MICVCVNARGEAAESWRRAPSPSSPGRMPEAWAQPCGLRAWCHTLPQANSQWHEEKKIWGPSLWSVHSVHETAPTSRAVYLL